MCKQPKVMHKWETCILHVKYKLQNDGVDTYMNNNVITNM